VVTSLADEDVGDVADDALRVGVVLALRGSFDQGSATSSRNCGVLTGAVDPCVGVDDVLLAFGMHETQEAARDNGDDVPLIVDVADGSVGVNIIGKGFVSDSRQAVGDRLESRPGREVQGQIHGRDQSNCATQGVANDGDRRRTIPGHRSLYCSEDSCGGFGLCSFEAVVHLNGATDSREEGTVQGVQEEVAIRYDGYDF